ncbi:MAG: methylamine utilization protein [Gammaproteobacteria bacterium]|nr:methylamine utilization protein [Gammaproteobacteria bacterium]
MRRLDSRKSALFALAAFGYVGAGPAFAGQLEVTVLDHLGQPVPEIAVYAEVNGGPMPSPQNGLERASVTMNQRDLAFSPHILIVTTGTAVTFPNDDDVRHHVYSFSPTKQLNLTIDSGDTHEPRTFDVPGIVTLGCNIHDDMLAYVVVVDTPHFAKSDENGRAILDGLAPGQYRLNLWTPRAAPKNLPGPLDFTVGEGQTIAIEHRFENKLFPPHRHSETSLHWAHY